MPRFYVDVDDGEQASYDIEGISLDDADDARREAILRLTQTVTNTLPDGNERNFRADLRDEQRKVIFRASVSFRSHWIK